MESHVHHNRKISPNYELTTIFHCNFYIILNINDSLLTQTDKCYPPAADSCWPADSSESNSPWLSELPELAHKIINKSFTRPFHYATINLIKSFSVSFLFFPPLWLPATIVAAALRKIFRAKQFGHSLPTNFALKSLSTPKFDCQFSVLCDHLRPPFIIHSAVSKFPNQYYCTNLPANHLISILIDYSHLICLSQGTATAERVRGGRVNAGGQTAAHR